MAAEFRAIARALEDSDALFVGGSRERDLRQRLERAQSGTPEAVELRVLLGRELLRLGKSVAALAELQRALEEEHALWETAGARGLAADTDRQLRRRRKLLFQLVVAATRMGEQANCVAHHHPRSCILPIVGDAVHVDQEGARMAMDYALEYLHLAPGDLKGIWFLNLTAMQSGAYPDRVPPRFRIRPERFVARADIGRFRDVAPALGVDTFDQAGGSIADDLDGDGYIDIVTSSMDPWAHLVYLHNEGDGTFADWSAAAGLTSQLGGLNLNHTDYDNDGRVDLFVLRGGWLQERGRVRNSLLRNDSHHTFTDVTRAAGLAEPAYPTQTGAWADYDNDGDLDLSIGNEGMRTAEGMTLFPDNLFRNNGDGTFTDVAVAAGVTNDRFAKGVAWGDFDGDAHPDLYVSNLGPNRLYRNQGDGTFTDVGPALGVIEPAGRSFATWFFDHDQDGDLDLFVAAYEASIEEIAADVMGRDRGRSNLWPRLYRNDDGRFTDVTVAAGLDHPSLPMGANFGDIDEDGFPDIYLGTGSPSFEALMPNVMYLNNGDGTFTDVTYAGGFGHLQKGHGISLADFDRDGDADVALQAGGMYPGDRFPNALFENPGHGRHFVSIQAVGRRSNRAAIGARIHVRVATPCGERSIYRWVSTGGSFGGSPLEQLIGLGEATAIRFVEVRWPTSGSRQRFTDVPVDAFLRIREGENRFERLHRRRVQLAPGAAPEFLRP